MSKFSARSSKLSPGGGDVPRIVFSDENLVDKKRITRFLVKNQIDFFPIGNRKDEYETIIKIRTPSPRDKTLRDRSTGRNIKSLMNILNSSSRSLKNTQDRYGSKVNMFNTADSYEGGQKTSASILSDPKYLLSLSGVSMGDDSIERVQEFD